MTTGAKWHEVSVPGSSANLGSGYDTLALALDIRLLVRFRGAELDRVLSITGEDAEVLNGKPADNVIFQAANEFCDRRGVRCQGFEIEVDNGIPIRSGLGSSTAARTAGILIGASICGIVVSRDDVFREVARQENHADNAAAAVYGGFMACARADEDYLAVRFPLNISFTLGVIVPGYKKHSTDEMRRILPKCVPMVDAVFNLQRVAMLIAGLGSGNESQIRLGLSDALHQPFRASCLPGVGEILGTPTPGIAAVISGAGPSILLFPLSEEENAFARILEQFRLSDPAARLLTPRISQRGFAGSDWHQD